MTEKTTYDSGQDTPVANAWVAIPQAMQQHGQVSRRLPAPPDRLPARQLSLQRQVQNHGRPVQPRRSAS